VQGRLICSIGLKRNLLSQLVLSRTGMIESNVFHFIFPFRYLKDLQRCLSLYSEKGEYSADETEHLAALYKSLREQYPMSSAVKV
jgi:hypothetical protein